LGGISPPKLPVATGLGLGLGQVLSKFLLAMYPFSISIDELVSLKFLMTKRLWKITRIMNVFINKHIMILKIVFIDLCITMSK